MKRRRRHSDINVIILSYHLNMQRESHNKSALCQVTLYLGLMTVALCEIYELSKGDEEFASKAINCWMFTSRVGCRARCFLIFIFSDKLIYRLRNVEIRGLCLVSESRFSGLTRKLNINISSRDSVESHLHITSWTSLVRLFNILQSQGEEEEVQPRKKRQQLFMSQHPISFVSGSKMRFYCKREIQ